MDFRPVVIAPTFNNARTLPDVLRRIDAQGTPVIVVNDGATDATTAVLEQWSAEPRSHAGIVETHPKNRGKAAALMTGFRLAQKLGYTHALSIDTDGQLAPEQIPQMLDLAERDPEAVILGVRDASASDYPSKSKLGRRVSNLLVWMEGGIRVSDSQCGLRVYPLAMKDLFRCRAGRYGFETEVLVRAGWAGWPIVETPVRCTYFAGAQRVSHFRPWRDSFRAFGMHVRLVARALVPFRRSSSKRVAGEEERGRGGEGETGRRGDRETASISPSPRLPVSPSPPRPLSAFRRLLHWLSPREAWRQLKQDRPEGSKRTAMAGGLAIGAFIGCTPAYGLHAIFGLYAARRLNLNPLGVVLGTQIACPPLGVLMAMLSVGIGHILLHGGIPPLSDFAPLWDGWTGFLQLGRWFFIDWIVGSLVVGLASLIVVFFLADSLLRRLPVETPTPDASNPAGGTAGA